MYQGFYAYCLTKMMIKFWHSHNVRDSHILSNSFKAQGLADLSQAVPHRINVKINKLKLFNKSAWRNR